MKVLLISAAFPPMLAGESDYALHLSRRLSGRGLDVHLLTTRQNSGDPKEMAFSLHPIMPSWSWRAFPRFIAFLKKLAPDVVILISPGWLYDNFHPMTTFAATVTKALLPRTTFITQFAYIGEAPERVPFWTRLIRRFVKQWAGTRDVDWEFGTLIRDSDLVAVMSEIDQRRLLKSSPAFEDKFSVIPPPPILRMCDDENVREKERAELGLKENDFLLAFFGYVYPSKGVETLLQAMRLVCEKRDNVRLLMIGGGQAKSTDTDHQNIAQIGQCALDMKKLAADIGIGDQVIWTGGYAADSDRASAYLFAADAGVFPFDAGVTMIRSSIAAAVTHGLPIITTRGKVLESPFLDRENIYLCPPQDPESVASAINALIDNPDLLENIAQGSRKMAHDWFSWERLENRFVEAFGQPFGQEEDRDLRESVLAPAD